jgi:hypothetical protein
MNIVYIQYSVHIFFGTLCILTSKREKSKVAPLHAMEALGGKEIQLLLIHDLGTRWREESASRLCRAYPRGKDPRYSLDMSLDGPQSRSGHRG